MGHAATLARFESLRDSDTGDGHRDAPETFHEYVLVPEALEFYSGGHEGYVVDRFVYARGSDGRFRAPARLEG